MRELIPAIKKNVGYYYITLHDNGKDKKYYIHRLVNMFFNPNPRKLTITDHINNNKLDNRASNLRWCTQKENLNNPNSNKIKGVARYSLEGEFIDSRQSIMSYQEEFGFNHNSIIQCCKGRTKSAYGYKWEYLDKDGYLPF